MVSKSGMLQRWLQGYVNSLMKFASSETSYLPPLGILLPFDGNNSRLLISIKPETLAAIF
jgi:hypothetical protein